jgi:hypothetical protein
MHTVNRKAMAHTVGKQSASVDVSSLLVADVNAMLFIPTYFVSQRVNTEAAMLRAERVAYEEAVRAAAEAAKRAELAQLRREAAAYMIQNR